MKYLLFGLVFIGFFLSYNGNVPDVTNGLDINGNHVCSYMEKVSAQVVKSTSTPVIVKVVINTTCGWWRKPCSKTVVKTKLVTVYRHVTKYFDRNVYYCCSGWTRANRIATGCEKPICNVNCRNGGQCVSPDNCSCKAGYEGKYCQLDKDECKDKSKNNCEQICINENGGFKCGCLNGFKLNSDQQTCKDINECNRPTAPCGCANDDGVCNSTCANTRGSYTCGCNNGYRLNSAQKCEDINECFLNSKLCDQMCINTPGSYRCGCASGYTFNGTSCVDINECAVKNGGCSDNCLNINGSYLCTCPDGFYLTKDRKTCKVIEPTTKNKVVCESDQIGFLSCDKFDENIVIIDAVYGRLTTKHCQKNNYTQNVRCKAADPTTPLRTTCNNKASCLFYLQKDIFGDPCPGIEKYMQVLYECLK